MTGDGTLSGCIVGRVCWGCVTAVGLCLCRPYLAHIGRALVVVGCTGCGSG